MIIDINKLQKKIKNVRTQLKKTKYNILLAFTYF